MGYIKKSLADNEKIVASFNLNFFVFLNSYLGIALGISFIGAGAAQAYFKFIQPDIPLVALTIIFIGSIVLLYSFISYLKLASIDMGMTQNRIVYKSGIIAINTEEIRTEAVETVEVKQSILGRLLCYGNVLVTGKGTSSILFKDVDNPVDIKRTIANNLNKKDND